MKNVSVWLRGLVLMMLVAVACSSPEKPETNERLGKIASALTTRYQAEAMSWSGALGSDGEIVTDPAPAHRYIWSDSFIAQTHTFVGGATTITVRAMGELMNGVGPHIVVTVGGVQVGSAYVSETTWTDKAFSFNVAAGAQEIRVTFDNDDQNATEDRNLLVDWMEVDDPGAAPSCTDTTYEAEAMTWSGTAGSDGEISSDPTPTHLYMWTNGSVTKTHTFAAGAMRVRVRAAGELLGGVGPHIVVKVNGTEIGSATVNETSWTDKTFDFVATEGSQEIRVTYENDGWVGTEDRNLRIDKIEVLCGGSDDGGTSEGGTDGGGGTSEGGSDASSCSPETCTSTSACILAQCTASGCEQTSAPAGTSCSDGNACNGAETCNGAGACLAGTPPNADDGNPCTADACDPVLGVVHTPLEGASCSDGNPCNGEEICTAAGACEASSTPVIDDGNPCTIDGCDPSKGVTHTATLSGSCAPPALDPTVAASIANDTQFLYSGNGAIQENVAPGTVDKARAAVVRGRVLDADGVTPKPSALVTLLGHPELGYTYTRADGWYDLAVNGGTTYTVDIAASGFLRMQRHVDVDWHGWGIADDVVLTPAQSSADPFAPGVASAQLVRGAVTPAGEDADGARRAVLRFPENTRITNFTVADGTPLQVQVTEFTRGARGPDRMPGELPPTSGYTYAFEASIPSAAAAGVSDVVFDRDVQVYVDNFTHYPVGETVPLGYYDRAKGAWLAEKSGRIIKVLTTDGGVATVDVTGDGVADTGTALADLGITSTELANLAAEYPARTELWRVSMRHFSAWDCNWGYGPPPDASPPPVLNAGNREGPNDPCTRQGSIIGCESRTLGENLPIVGTPFALHYQSNRARGFKDELRVRISDATALPSSLLRARVEIEAAGRRLTFEKPVPLLPNDTFAWTWDGLDAYGRELKTGSVTAHIRVGYEYAATATKQTVAFSDLPLDSMSGDRLARTVTIWREETIPLARGRTESLGFGGWTLDAHHLVDLDAMSLFQGDGVRRDNAGILGLVEHVAGGGAYTTNQGDNGPAAQAYIGSISDIAESPDGSLYLAHDGYWGYGRLRRIDRNGIITSIAGVPPLVSPQDGIPALHADLQPTHIALSPEGGIFVAAYSKHQIWKIEPGLNPIIHLVAGTGVDSNSVDCPAMPGCGDGGDAKLAMLRRPEELAVSMDGSLLVHDAGHEKVRRIGPEGNISNYYAAISSAMQLRKDGVVFLKGFYDDQHQGILRIDPSGNLSVVSRPGTTTPIDPYADWCSDLREFIASPGDSFFMTCHGRVFTYSASGQLFQLAGPQSPTTYGYSGDGGPAVRALFTALGPLLVGHQGELLVADQSASRIRRLRPRLGVTSTGVFHVPSEDGAQIFEFDARGRHLRTVSALTGSVIYTFGYDPTLGQLASIIDGSGNETLIARSGSTVTITAPHGQVTTIALDANGHLASLTNPVTTEVTQLVHDSSGLLTDLWDPRGDAHHFEYGADGRLIRDVNAIPGSEGTRLDTVFDANGWTVTITSPEGRVTTHRVDRSGALDPAVRERRTITRTSAGANLTTTIDKYADGAHASVAPDGTKRTVLATAADPRWGGSMLFDSSVRTDIGHPTTTHSMTRTESRSATLATPGDPWSVTSQTITTVLSGAGLSDATTTRVFAAGPPATWTTTTPAGRQTRETLDALERVTEVAVLGSTPVTLAPLQYHYDAQGRVDQVTRGSRVYTATFDPTTGWVQSTNDPAGLGVTFQERDASGRPKLVTLPGGGLLSMSYDLAGNIVSVAPPNKPAHGFSWGPTNLLANYTAPDLGFAPKDTPYTHDKDGLLVQMAQPEATAAYGYDGLGRLAQAVDSVTKTFAYDPQGRLATLTTSDGVTVTNTYDGSLVSQEAVSGPFAHALNRTFDNFLRVSSWDLDGASPTSVSYDGDGFVTAAGGMTVTRSTNALLTATALGSVSDSFGYNVYGEVTSHSVTGAATGYTATYDRDGAGRIHVLTETIDGATHSARYEYDSAGRLWQVYLDGAGAPTREFTYDGNGNRAGGTYDAQDRMLSFGNFSYEYGPNGELRKKTDNVTLAESLYVYDAHGSLRHVDRPTPLAAIDYVIDGKNRRIGKKVGGALVQGFLYDGARMVAELDGTGAVVARFVYATGSHSPDVMVKNGASYRIVKDHLGSPRLVVDSTTGAVAQRLDFDEWGSVTADTNPGFQPFGFAGGLWDRDTNLVRFGARDYDPTTGRWTTKDSSRFGGGLNFYAYANLDPINFVDPGGEEGVLAATLGLLMGGGEVGAGAVGAVFANPLVPLIGINVAVWGAVGYNAAALANEWDSDVILGSPKPLEARKGRDREGDDTRGLTPEQIEEKFKGKKTPEQIKDMIKRAQKFRGERNRQKRRGNGGRSWPMWPFDDDDDDCP